MDGGVLVPEMTGGVGALICTEGGPPRSTWSCERVMQVVPESSAMQSCFVVKLLAKLATVASRLVSSEEIVCRGSPNRKPLPGLFKKENSRLDGSDGAFQLLSNQPWLHS